MKFQPPQSPDDVRQIISSLEYECVEPYRVQSAQTTLRRGRGHCLDTSLAAAYLMEPLGYKPHILSMYFVDNLGVENGHSVFLYQTKKGYATMGQSSYASLRGCSTPSRFLVDLIDTYETSLQDLDYFLQQAMVEDWSTCDVAWRDSQEDLSENIQVRAALAWDKALVSRNFFKSSSHLGGDRAWKLRPW